AEIKARMRREREAKARREQTLLDKLAANGCSPRKNGPNCRRRPIRPASRGHPRPEHKPAAKPAAGFRVSAMIQRVERVVRNWAGRVLNQNPDRAKAADTLERLAEGLMTRASMSRAGKD